MWYHRAIRAGEIVLGARQAAGLSQRGLALRARVSQSSLSRIEAGLQDPTSNVLGRLLNAAGGQISWVPNLGLSAAATATSLIGAASEVERKYILFQLSDDLAAADPVLKGALCAAPPAFTEKRRLDAAIAGLVEHRLSEVGIAAPHWTLDPRRSTPEEWLVCGIEALREITRAETPEPLRRRGVAISVRDLGFRAGYQVPDVGISETTDE